MCFNKLILNEKNLSKKGVAIELNDFFNSIVKYYDSTMHNKITSLIK